MAKAVVATQQVPDVRKVRLNQIDVGPANIRTHMRDEALGELKESIEKLGLLQPIVVMERKKPKPGQRTYSLVLGSRRVRAHKDLGKDEIDAVVVKEQARERVLAASLAENLFRSKLSHKDIAKAVTDLYKLYGNDAKEVAKATGMWPETVLRYVYLEEYGTKKMVKWVEEGKFKLLDVKRMLKAAQWNMQKAERMLQAAIDEGMTPTQRKNFAEYMEANPSARTNDGVEDAKKPRVRRRIFVDLPPEMRHGVQTAMKDYEMDADEVALQALREWLEDQGYIE